MVGAPKWHLPAPGSSWEHKLPKIVATQPLQPEVVPVTSYFAGKLSKISKWLWPILLSDSCLCAGSRRVWDFVCILWEQSLCFLQPSGTQSHKPCWPSKADGSGARLPTEGPLGWEARYGAYLPHSLGRTSLIAIILALWVTYLRNVNLDYTVPPTHLIVVPSLWL